MSTKHTKLSDLAEIRAGYQTRGRVENEPDGSHALLQLRDFDDERSRVNLGGMVRITPGRINKAQALRDGDLVFLAKGGRNFAFAPRGLPQPSLAASYFFLIRPGEAIDPDYLVWFLNLEVTRAFLARAVGRGVHMPVVRREYLENLQVPLPSLERQRTIAAMDALGREQHRLTVELANKRRLLVTAACRRVAERPREEQED